MVTTHTTATVRMLHHRKTSDAMKDLDKDKLIIARGLSSDKLWKKTRAISPRPKRTSRPSQTTHPVRWRRISQTQPDENDITPRPNQVQTSRRPQKTDQPGLNRTTDQTALRSHPIASRSILMWSKVPYPLDVSSRDTWLLTALTLKRTDWQGRIADRVTSWESWTRRQWEHRWTVVPRYRLYGPN